MAKASAPGRTKTRLVPPLTPGEAAEFNTAFLTDVVANIRAAGADAAVAGYVAYGPAGAAPFFAGLLPPEVPAFEAALPTFGQCLRHALVEVLARGHASAAVLNSDSPTLPPQFLAAMALALAEPGDRAVLGPSDDGGYYALGLKTPHACLFADIDWSTGRVTGQTLARAAEIGLPVHVLPTWYDVDDAAALRTLHDELFAGVPFARSAPPRGAARATGELMRRLIEREGLEARLRLRPVRPREEYAR